MVNPFDPTQLGGALFWIGAAVFFVTLILLGLVKAVPRKGAAVLMGIGAAILVIGLIISVATPTPTASVSNVPNTAVSSYLTSTGAYYGTGTGAGSALNTTAGWPSGTSYNSQTNTLTIYTVYVSKIGTLCMASANASLATCYSFLSIGVHSARTDIVNVTSGFTFSFASVPTFQSLGSNPQTYSFLGYKPATSTATGQWQAYWSLGSNGGQVSQVNAPSATTNIVSSLVGISAFSSTTNFLHITLAGSNGTSFPSTAYSALTTYSSYSATLSVQSSTPATLTVTWVILGEQPYLIAS